MPRFQSTEFSFRTFKHKFNSKPRLTIARGASTVRLGNKTTDINDTEKISLLLLHDRFESAAENLVQLE